MMAYFEGGASPPTPPLRVPPEGGIHGPGGLLILHLPQAIYIEHSTIANCIALTQTKDYKKRKLKYILIHNKALTDQVLHQKSMFPILKTD